MDKLESSSHTPWDCKFHVVFIPKYPSVDDERCTDSFGCISERCSESWRNRGNAEWKKAT